VYHVKGWGKFNRNYGDFYTGADRWKDGPQQRCLRTGGHEVDLDAITAVWNRRPEAPIPRQDLTSEDGNFVRRESNHLLESLWLLLGDRFWVNPYLAERAAARKPYQLSLASAVGLEVPRTLITNDPRHVADFFERCKGQMIYKTFTSYARDEGGVGRGIYTTRVQRDDLLSRLPEVALAPCLFQEYVPKSHELRITVIGRKMFAVEIHSQQNERAKDDWRRAMTTDMCHRATVLPEALQTRIHNLMARLGIVFGCIDMILTPDGRFIFLEINPSGQWLEAELLTGMPLVTNFAQMLIEGTANYSEPALSANASAG
jgi:glutathione synthase/RimK-type ligase-like ATP-grasp enzyme